MTTPKSIFTVILTLCLSSLFLISCGGWTEKEKAQFVESHEVLNLDRSYCDCVLGKAMKKFGNMAAINKDEAAMAEIIVSADCLEKISTTDVEE